MTSEQQALTHVRRLTKYLLLSVGGNILLLTLLFYWMAKETPPRPYCELKPAVKQEKTPPIASNLVNEEVLRAFRKLSREELIAKLSDKQLIDHGFTQRDLALSALVSFHYFDLQRALAGQSQTLQERKIPFGKDRLGNAVEAILYTEMTDAQFDAIAQFAKTERWPITPRGMYFLLRKENHDPSLAEAFFMTPEFSAVDLLFNRSGVHLEKSELLKVVLQGTWKALTQFSDQQRAAQDLSPARRQRFLLDYIAMGSQHAASLLLKTDGAYAAQKLDDTHILSIIQLSQTKSPEAEQFALDLLTSPRGNAVWNAAADLLFLFSGIAPPENNKHHAALQKFLPQALPKTDPVSILPQKTLASAPKKVEKKYSEKKPIEIKPVDIKPVEIKPVKPIERKGADKKHTVAKNPSTPKPQQKTISKPTLEYIVKEGDSLWKIAKRFKVDVEIIKKLNHLKSDALKPGFKLVIPKEK